MDVAKETRRIAGGLRAAADPRRAAREKRYLKSDLIHLGVPVPRIRAVVKTFVREHPGLSRTEMIAMARSLWKEPVHERRTAVVELLTLHRDLLGEPDLRFVEKLIRGSGTWAVVDPLAIDVAGHLVARFSPLGETLDRWTRDDDFWLRRSALLALLRPLMRGEGDFARFGRYADPMLSETEFFSRKAIGWVLRETSKKRPGLVSEWLTPRAARASGVTVREAVKYLPEEQRREIMRAYLSSRGRPSTGSRRRAR